MIPDPGIAALHVTHPMPDDEKRNEPAAEEPRPKHTLGQKIFRELFKAMGPAQVGPPPYATAEELEAYARQMAPPPPTRREAAPGHRVVYYTDPNGNPRRMIVRKSGPGFERPGDATADPAE